MDDGAHLGFISIHKEARRLHLDEERLGADQLAGRLAYAAIGCDGTCIRFPGSEVLGQGDRQLRLAILIGRHLSAEESRILEVLAHRDDAQTLLAASTPATTARG